MMTQATKPVQLRLSWVKDQARSWCQLNTVDLTHSAVQVAGVYVIWCGPSGQHKASVVYVGQGAVKDRLADHRDDQRIQKYADRTLYVTWATVRQTDRDGVEAYITKRYAPLVGERRPAATPISVNPPWD